MRFTYFNELGCEGTDCNFSVLHFSLFAIDFNLEILQFWFEFFVGISECFILVLKHAYCLK
jgi:hypothetical protein